MSLNTNYISPVEEGLAFQVLVASLLIWSVKLDSCGVLLLA